MLGGGGRPTAEFKQPAPVGVTGDLILPPYKSLGAVFPKESSPPQGERERKKKMSSGMAAPSNAAKARSAQHLAERSFSVSENSRPQNLSSSTQSRTPHRTAGYGGAGHPSRGPHRFGHPDMRASYSERLSTRQRGAYPVAREVYKSNSSLDLDHEAEVLQESSGGGSRREYGSHGSLDVMGRREEPTGLGLFPTSEGPAAVSTLTRHSVLSHNSHLNRSEESTGSVISTRSEEHGELEGGTSPKQKKKAINFWGNKDKTNRKSQKSLFKKKDTKEGGSKGVDGLSDGLDNRAEDKHRRRFFSHHDIGSVCASLSVTAQLRTLQRRNTTTGASAASAALRNCGGGDSPESEDGGDPGDGVSNEQVLR